MKMHDECGVIGIHCTQASEQAVLGLQALQHRGQESAGVASWDGSLHLHKAMGLVDAVFSLPHFLPGSWAIGHNRYSTCGSSSTVNAGPFVAETPLGPLAVAHNGNLVNAAEVTALLQGEYGIRPKSDSDTELITLLLAVAPGDSWGDRIRWMASIVRGSFSLVLLTRDSIIAVRDAMGNRPLSLGKLPGGWAFASESCALSLLAGSYVRDVEPGEILEINSRGPHSLGALMSARRAFCAFESIYIARPDTVFRGRAVHSIRRAIGEELGREEPADADLVIGVPDSGTSSALGYSTSSGIPFGEGLIKNRYIGRTFIQPEQAERERLLRMKFGVLPLHGKRLVLVDDSIVRGNTLRPIVSLLKEAGAKAIHVRIASPPIKEPCYLGVDMASHDELIANEFNEDEVARHVGADSLRHISIPGLIRALGSSPGDTCLACFNGDYPLSIDSVRRATWDRRPVEVVA